MSSRSVRNTKARQLYQRQIELFTWVTSTNKKNAEFFNIIWLISRFCFADFSIELDLDFIKTCLWFCNLYACVQFINKQDNL